MNLTMNTLLQSLASDDWARVVQALFHTLWVGALLALVLCLALRRTTNPFARYRACVAALTGVMFGGLVAWAWLESGLAPLSEAAGSLNHASRFTPHAPSSAAPPSQAADSKDHVSRFTFHASPSAARTADSRAFAHRYHSWLPWLALGWLLGTASMLARSVASVVGAERLRASAAPLEDEGVQRLVQAARRRLAMTRQVRLAVTERLASPAVVGVVVPTLILPLTLLTTIPANQLQLILLHELAHIRRGDYLANLFQFVIESILFFNPAVWWLSRQMRLEREACCDALAVGLAENRLEYARALACVAEQALASGPTAAPAFADRRHPSALRDRLQRLLVPGYRPALRLTWKALLASLFLGGALLLLSALGTRWTLKAAAQLLSPQQRIERIENAMKKMGEPPADFTGENDSHIPATVVLRTPDGSAMPHGTYGAFISLRPRQSAVIGATPDENGVCRASVSRGTLFFYAIGADGFAPAYLGPIDTRASNEVEDIELTLQRGFPVSIKAIDADSGQPLADATLNCQFWFPEAGQSLGAPQPIEADQQGAATLAHCVSLPLGVTVIKPGYEMVEQRFDPPKSNATLTVSARRALPLAGRITDTTGGPLPEALKLLKQRVERLGVAEATGGPVPEAALYILHAENAPGLYGNSPDHPGQPLTVTDAQGRYLLNQLPRSGRFWLLVRAEGHADAILSDVHPGQTNLQAVLGPELRVSGRVTGNLDLLPRSNQGPRLTCGNDYRAGNSSYQTSKSVPVRIEGDTGYFEFVSPIAGLVTLGAGDRTFKREVNAPVKDWVIDLSPETNPPPVRTVTLRFEHPSKVPPKGTVSVLLPTRESNMAASKEMEIRDGEVSFEVPLGRAFSFEPAHTVGYWFEQQMNVKVGDGPGPLVIPVPVIPAGAIYAQARKADGSLAGNVSFTVADVKRSPLAKPEGFPTTPSSDGWSPDGGPRKYVASPLPLGGAYLVIAWQTNNFAVSEPIKLTEENPDRHVELQFTRGVPITGQVVSQAGRPLAHAPVDLSWNHPNHGFGMPERLADQDGRFTFDDCNPRLGQYTVKVRSPGCRSSNAQVNFSKLPLTVRLEPGLKLSGRVLEAKSKRPVISAEVRAWTESGNLPNETTRTDEQGRFSFDTLSDARYRLYVEGCNPADSRIDRLYKAGAAQPVRLDITVIPGATVKLGEEPQERPQQEGASNAPWIDLPIGVDEALAFRPKAWFIPAQGKARRSAAQAGRRPGSTAHSLLQANGLLHKAP